MSRVVREQVEITFPLRSEVNGANPIFPDHAAQRDASPHLQTFSVPESRENAKSLLKAHGIEIAFFDDESDANWLFGNRRKVAFSIPGEFRVCGVAFKGIAFGE